DDSDGPEDRYLEQESGDEQDDSKDDHGCEPFCPPDCPLGNRTGRAAARHWSRSSTPNAGCLCTRTEHPRQQLKTIFRQTGDKLVSLRYCACVNKRGHPTNGEVMAGKHRARTTARRYTEAPVLLGTGAITLGLGIALTTGAGVAAADSNNNSSSS